jgi:hypothetical protein
MASVPAVIVAKLRRPGSMPETSSPSRPRYQYSGSSRSAKSLVQRSDMPNTMAYGRNSEKYLTRSWNGICSASTVST